MNIHPAYVILYAWPVHVFFTFLMPEWMCYRTLKTYLPTRMCAIFAILVNKPLLTLPTNPLPSNLGYNPTYNSKSPIPANFFQMIREIVLEKQPPNVTSHYWLQDQLSLYCILKWNTQGLMNPRPAVLIGGLVGSHLGLPSSCTDSLGEMNCCIH